MQPVPILRGEFPGSWSYSVGIMEMEIAPFLQTEKDNNHGAETTLMVGASLSSFLIGEITKWTRS